MTYGRSRLYLLRLKAFAVAGAMVAAFGSHAPAFAQGAKQRSFATPQAAIETLAEAARAHDAAALDDILGPEFKEALSGDPVRDKMDGDRFASLVAEKLSFDEQTPNLSIALLGDLQWPFPIPVVRDAAGWRFDTHAGIDEILSRRIGANETAAILLCRAYAMAQWEYFTNGDWDNDSVAEYAQKLSSSEGMQDGLYWPTADDETPSPLGPLVAFATAKGYSVKNKGNTETGAPFYGYRFKILTAQGPAAPGGAYSYIVNGNMIGGYALVAYPESWGKSGVMTFIINQQGRVYQKNLGANTTADVAAMSAYNPDPSWTIPDE